MHSYGSALALIGVGVPLHRAAESLVPVLCGAQAQGDILVLPTSVPLATRGYQLPGDGVRLVQGEATGNTHWLHPGFDSPGVTWAVDGTDPLILGYLKVPSGQTALLIHTDEHGANGIGPGEYVIRRKRQLDVEVAAQGEAARQREAWRASLVVD